MGGMAFVFRQGWNCPKPSLDISCHHINDLDDLAWTTPTILSTLGLLPIP